MTALRKNLRRLRMNWIEAMNALYEGKKIWSKKYNEIYVICSTPMGKFILEKCKDGDGYPEANTSLVFDINSEYEVVE
jgi:hypothetical protein